jgi:hypothetical protein
VEDSLIFPNSTASKSPSRSAQIPPELEVALRAHVPDREQLVWVGRPSIAHAVERATNPGMHRMTILGGGYSLLIGAVAAYVSGHLAWLAIPAVALTGCGLALYSDHRRRERLTEALAHTVYALTVRHAMIVQSKPALRLCTVPLSEVQPVRHSGSDPAVSDLLFNRAAGTPAAVFSDLEDAPDIQEFVTRLKTAPEVMEQQFALVAQWAALRWT